MHEIWDFIFVSDIVDACWFFMAKLGIGGQEVNEVSKLGIFILEFDDSCQQKIEVSFLINLRKF